MVRGIEERRREGVRGEQDREAERVQGGEREVRME